MTRHGDDARRALRVRYRSACRLALELRGVSASAFVVGDGACLASRCTRLAARRSRRVARRTSPWRSSVRRGGKVDAAAVRGRVCSSPTPASCDGSANPIAPPSLHASALTTCRRRSERVPRRSSRRISPGRRVRRSRPNRRDDRMDRRASCAAGDAVFSRLATTSVRARTGGRALVLRAGRVRRAWRRGRVAERGFIDRALACLAFTRPVAIASRCVPSHMQYATPESLHGRVRRPRDRRCPSSACSTR